MAAKHLELVRGEPARDIAGGDGMLAPHDYGAECALLTAVLANAPDLLPKVDGFLRPEHFFAEAHRQIFKAVLDVKDSGIGVDIVNVLTRLKDSERLEQVGGTQYLVEMMNDAPAILNVGDYATSIVDKARLRKTIDHCRATAARAYLGIVDAQEYIDDAAKGLIDIGRSGVRRNVESNRTVLGRIVKNLERGTPGLGEDRVTGIPTGLRAYDRLTQGLHAGHKTTIVALPKVGKTAMALQIAANVAAHGIGAVYFILEMSREEALTRLLSAWSSVDGERLKRAPVDGLNPDEWRRIHTAQGKLGALPLHIEDTPTVSIDDVRALTIAQVDEMRMRYKAPLGLFVVDYVQRLVATPTMAKLAAQGRIKKHDWVGHNSKGIKLLAQELKIPGLELAQQKPSPVDPRTKLRPKPTKGQTADCSEIEKESDEVIYLHRKPKYGVSGGVVGEDPRAVTMILAAGRSVAEGEVDLTYRGEFSRFEDCGYREDSR